MAMGMERPRGVQSLELGMAMEMAMLAWARSRMMIRKVETLRP
jgi:hypothetical protein